MPTRPTSWPSWATDANYPAGSDAWSGQPTKVTPAGGQQAAGYAPNTKPPAQWENWFKNKVATGLDWLRHLPTLGDDTPQSVFTDAAGNNRWIIDHNGYPMGRATVIQQNWGWDTTSRNTTTTLPDVTWKQTVGNAAGTNAAVIAEPFTYVTPLMQLTPGTNASDRITVHTAIKAFAAADYVDMVLEFEFAMSAIGGNNVNWALGLSDTVSTPLTNLGGVDRMFFAKRSTDTNWQYCASGPTHNALALNDSGVPPVANTMQRFRIEYHGGSTAFSAYTGTVRFFINEVLVGEIHNDVSVGGGGMYLMFFGERQAANGVTGLLSPVRMIWNRQLSMGAL